MIYRTIGMRSVFVFLVTFGIVGPSHAYEHADNPAYCFGLMVADAKGKDKTLEWARSDAINFFGQHGPKDSTDERDFDDWVNIGISDHADLTASARVKSLQQCKKWPKIGQ